VRAAFSINSSSSARGKRKAKRKRKADAPDLAQVLRHRDDERAHERDEGAAEEAVEDGVRDEERLGRHDAHKEGHGRRAEAAHDLDVEGPAAREKEWRERRDSEGQLTLSRGRARRYDLRRSRGRDAHIVGDEVRDDAAEERASVEEGEGVGDDVG